MSADNQQERSKKSSIIDPWYITGFVEGEGTFHMALYRDPKMKFGIKIIPEFHISQSYLRINTLKEIQQFFACGYLKENHRLKKNDVTYVYVVRNREDLLTKIIPFFVRYPLISDKQKSFLIFKEVVKYMQSGKYSEYQGIKRLIHLAYSMNDAGRYRKINKQDLLTSLKSSETIR